MNTNIITNSIRFMTFMAVFALIGTFAPFSTAFAQKATYLDWQISGDEAVNNLVKQALKKEIDEYKEQFQSLPIFQTALTDLNGDGKPEILARFVEEYYFRDENNNTKTYVFAYTSKGMIKILETMAGDIAIGQKDQTGLNQIIRFNGLTSQYTIFQWDGKRRYVQR